MAYVTDIRVGGISIADRFAELRATLATRLDQRRVYNQTFSELNALTDRDLYDLGIARSSIRSIAYEAAYK